VGGVLLGQTLRFESGLVQVDAVVTGRDGQRTAGLAADDFEVRQDGKARKILRFSYVAEARRMAVLVDDISMPAKDVAAVRGALARFIGEEMRGGDQMSIAYTSHGAGALRQFTGDKQVLRRAVDGLNWRPPVAGLAFPGMAFFREVALVLSELGGFPGRKSLVLIAPGEGTPLTDIRSVGDTAGRASVAVYGVDTGPRNRESESLMSRLASATGGSAVHDTSAALELLRTAAADAGGYYLIGWDPGEWKAQEYRRVQIRMRDRSLRARTREGYFARMGTAAPWQAAPASAQMRQALQSAFHSGDLEVSLTATFQRQEAAGSSVASLVHIPADGVRFEQDAGGCANARLEFARAIWPVDPGAPAGDRVYTSTLDVHACGDEAARMRRDGLVAAVEDRVPSPGAYQVRVAVRDENRVGAATQFLAIPDLRQGGAAPAGLMLWSGEAPEAAKADVSYRASRGGDPAVRRFRADEEVRYTLRSAREVRARVLREGIEVWATTAPGVGGALPRLAPGRYTFGVAAGATAQWVDFEIEMNE
jgi:VWFA-related protein